MQWLTRLKAGLSKSSRQINAGISGIFSGKALDQDLLNELEDVLVLSDIGPHTAHALTEKLRQERFKEQMSALEVRQHLAKHIADILKPVAIPLNLGKTAAKPHILLVVGVNGSGKTTTIGKLAQTFHQSGKAVMLVAGDTFRAAANEQLAIWGQRTGSAVIQGKTGSDPAALVYEAMEKAKATDVDSVIIDTAGRLHSNKDLMAELEKIVRVIKKQDPTAPHETVLVLDATTGQNALTQVETFHKTIPISGLIITKLDGSAKGGVVVALAQKFALPIHAIGIGEKGQDLKAFNANEYASALLEIP